MCRHDEHNAGWPLTVAPSQRVRSVTGSRRVAVRQLTAHGAAMPRPYGRPQHWGPERGAHRMMLDLDGEELVERGRGREPPRPETEPSGPRPAAPPVRLPPPGRPDRPQPRLVLAAGGQLGRDGGRSPVRRTPGRSARVRPYTRPVASTAGRSSATRCTRPACSVRSPAPCPASPPSCSRRWSCGRPTPTSSSRRSRTSPSSSSPRRSARSATAVVTLLSYLSLNYWFTPHYESFKIQRADDYVSLLAFIVVATVAAVTVHPHRPAAPRGASRRSRRPPRPASPRP